MKNIILQHWNGPLRELEKISVESMKEYAKYVGADYKLLLGHPFNKRYSKVVPDYVQKLAMYNKEFDGYDYTLMVDSDMVCVGNLKENVFELPGIGMHNPFQSSIFERQLRLFPQLTDRRYAYWGGAIYKMSLEIRKRLRKHMNHEELMMAKGDDEVYNHRLATLARIELEDEPIPDRWCYCSYKPEPEKAAIIHIRRKAYLNSTKRRSKIKNYNMLKSLGVFDAEEEGE